MSESEYLKGPCQHCAEPIEFPASGSGMAVDCPHCGQKTVLSAGAQEESESTASIPTPAADYPAEPEADPGVPAAPSRGRLPWMTAIVVIALLSVAGVGYFTRDRWSKASESDTRRPPSASENSTTAGSSSATTPAQPPATASTSAKSIDDLKVSAITLEKAKGSSLVYAVGTLRNNSDHQRFGVNIELELTDANGRKAGLAKDYRQVIEPRQEWRFRALVLDSKAVAAKVSAIREED
jgi:hypothetical protein